MASPSAISKVFSIPEILEHILDILLHDLEPPTNREDARSDKTQTNASVLLHLLRLSQVGPAWYRCIFHGSAPLQRALFLLPNLATDRSWQWKGDISPSQQTFYRDLACSAPVLNPIIQTVFPGYHFRYWRSGLGVDGDKDLAYNRHHAYIIVTRRNMANAQRCMEAGLGKNILRMLLAQPPPKELAVTIWERDDNPDTFASRTMSLRMPFIHSAVGVTMGLVLRRMRDMFREYGDVNSFKLTTT